MRPAKARTAVVKMIRSVLPVPFSSAKYWEQRYRAGGNSGAGSYGKLAAYKAEFINGFIRDHGVGSVIELGCGDGAQAARFQAPEYTGLDVSVRAVEMCRAALGDRTGWRFLEARERPAYAGRYDLALSLDVVYHLIEDTVFEAYMTDLFDHARSHVLIYSSDHSARGPAEHVRHREHGKWVAEHRPDWRRVSAYENPHAGEWPDGSFAFFTHYARGGA